MGKHSDHSSSWAATARTLFRDLRKRGTPAAGKHSSQAESAGSTNPSTGESPQDVVEDHDFPRPDSSVTTATGVLAVVNKRPVVAAIALPAVVTTAILASTLAMAPGQEASTVKAEAPSASATPSGSSAAPEGSPSKEPTPEAASTESEEKALEKQREEYFEKQGEKEEYTTRVETSVDLEEPEPEPTEEEPTEDPSTEAESEDSSSAEAAGDGEEDSGDASGEEPSEKDEVGSGEEDSVEDESTDGSSDDSTAGSEEDSSGVSGEACSVSSEIESGLSANAVAGYRAICAEFPEVTSFGGYRADSDSDHNVGKAVDAMISGSDGDRIAEWVIAHHSELDVKYVIWSQRIWMPGTGSWEYMEDRGSATANHYDHVHVSFN